MRKKAMTPEEFLKQMKEIEARYGDDPEAAHSRADDLACDVLKSLGYYKGVKVFKKVAWWCA